MKDERMLNDRLRKAAISCGLCDQWQQDWQYDWTPETMVSRFFRGIDFFFDKRFISNDDIKNLFDKDFLRRNGIIVDDQYSLLNPKYAAILGKGTSTIRMNAYNGGTVYVADNSQVKIIASGNAFVMVHVLGNAQIDTEQKDKASIIVLRHSNGCKVTASGNVRVKDELDWI